MRAPTILAILQLGAAFVAVPAPAQAQGFLPQGLDLSGFLAAEQRPFLESPAYPGQLSAGQLSLVLAPELRLRSDDRSHTFKLTPFLRVDSADSRTHVDLREGYWRFVRDDWELLVGVNTVFWGVTESRHLVDVVNQVDFLEDIDGEDKLGQPMINVGWQRDWGRLDAFVLLGFREMRFPGTSGRLRLPLPISDAARYPDGRGGVDLALRYAHYIGNFDLGVHVFRGTGREAAFVPSSPARAQLTPVYRKLTQVGVDLQYTRDAWLWKLEAIGRQGEGGTFGALVGGFEYTLYQALGAGDIGLLAEYLYDGRDATAPSTSFDNDLFVGARLALNDVLDTQLLAGGIVDLNDGSLAVRIEAERRLTTRLKLELEGRFFLNVAEGNVLSLFERDGFLNLRLAHSFWAGPGVSTARLARTGEAQQDAIGRKVQVGVVRRHRDVGGIGLVAAVGVLGARLRDPVPVPAGMVVAHRVVVDR